MKKKILGIFLLICAFLLVGCGEKLTPTDAVRDYLELYVTLDDSVIDQLNEFVDKEDLTDEQKKVYKEILRNEYSSLTYSIENEKIEEEVAYVKVKINVKDLSKVQNEALKYYEDHKEEFNDEEGKYDRSKFLDYKLLRMKDATDTVMHEIEFKVVKNGDNWNVSQLSNTDLEKLHGIYEE